MKRAMYITLQNWKRGDVEKKNDKVLMLMRCINVTEFGGPEVLQLSTSVSIPKPAANQVLVNVKAAGVNPVDTYIRSGAYAALPKLPYIPGSDGAGVVHQTGDLVTKFKKGDRVWFCKSETGSYSEYCTVNEDNVGSLPLLVSYEEGSMIGVPYLTAYRALFQRGKLKSGETVLIHGATGGVGTAAVQICKKSNGVRVIGTAGSMEGIEMLKGMGVDAVYNHREKDYIEEIKKNETEIDIIVEMLANINLDHDLQLVRRNGRIVIVGCRGPIEINPRTMMANEITVSGVMLAKSSPEERSEQIRYINDSLKDGWVKPVLWKFIELKNASDAHKEIMMNKGAKGQIVLKIDE